MSETERTAIKIHNLAAKHFDSAEPGGYRYDWAETRPGNKAACRAVARWHLRQLRNRSNGKTRK